MMTKENNKKSRTSEHSSAADIIVNDEGLLSEILVRVPARSLIRFKCVSKHWLSLISDPQFAIDHNRHNPSTFISGLYLNRPFGIQKPPIFVALNGHQRYPTFDFLKDVGKISDVYIRHACNGLMLCEFGTRYIVCNLTTQKYVLLPELGTASSEISKYELFGCCLAFDPLKSPNYKVVLLYSSVTTPGEISSHIYSSEAASWKGVCFTLPQLVYFYNVVFWNGAIHWVSYENVHVKFEVDEEKVTETQMPRSLKIRNKYMTEYFGECGGNLLLVRIYRYAKGCRILEMDRYSSSWTVKCRVNLRPVIASFPMAHRKLVLLCVLKRGNGKDLELVMGVPDELISYNLKEKTVKVLCDSALKVSAFYDCFCSFQVVESLSPV